jgi:siroheme synthase (precorrin-2 oxidase/ferrochelatase)
MKSEPTQPSPSEPTFIAGVDVQQGRMEISVVGPNGLSPELAARIRAELERLLFSGPISATGQEFRFFV